MDDMIPWEATLDETVLIANFGDVLQPVDGPLGTAKASADVRLRASAGKDAEILRILSRGTKVEVLLRGEGWTMVRCGK